MIKLSIGWNFMNSYIQLPPKMYTLLNPTPVEAPKAVIINECLAQELGLSNNELQSSGGIEQVYTGKEADALGADNHCFLMLEAKRGFYFTEYLTGELLETITKKDVEQKRFTLASHGYSPEKPQYGTVFIAKGNGIRDRVEVPKMELIDEGPTLARILGLRFDGVDGRVINEMLNLN